MEYRLLGPLEVSVNGSPVALGAPRQRAVLAALLLHANHVVTVNRLVQAVWWEPPRSESSNLRSYVTGLRQHLTRAGIPSERIGTRPSGYLMRVEPRELDLLVFERFAARGSQAVREEKLEAATEWLGDALRLWRGAPLDGVSLGPLLQRAAPGAWSCTTEAEGDLGQPAPGGELAVVRGALDCDLGLSPTTNSMPVLRHRLHEGGGPTDLLMAWVSVPDLAVYPSRQRYAFVRRESKARIVRFQSLDSPFEAEIGFDDDGVVLDYPGIARRVA